MKKEVKIGIFTILVILSAWAGVRFLQGSDILSRDQTFYATYDNVGGLQNSSSIFIRGVKVGIVSNVQLETERGAKVVVELAVKNDYHIPKDSYVKIFSDGVIGPKAIELVIGESDEYLASGDEIATQSTTDIFAVATDEIEHLKSKIDLVTDDLSLSLKSFNALLENNAVGLESMINNIDSLTHNLNAVVRDNSVNIGRVTEGFATFSQMMGNNSASVESIINNIDSLTQNLSNAEIDRTLYEINTLLAKINSGDGNVGKLMSDEVLYENITSLSANLDSLLYDLKRNPKRYVHFSLFGKKDSE